MLKLHREQELRQAGIDFGQTIDLSLPIEKQTLPGIHAADEMKLRGEARAAFLGGVGTGRAMAQCREIETRQGGAA